MFPCSPRRTFSRRLPQIEDRAIGKLVELMRSRFPYVVIDTGLGLGKCAESLFQLAAIKAMEGIGGWNFVVAPHVKTRSGSTIRSNASNIMVDRGSTRSIDMTYTQAADIYIGDASSQVYEFIRTPRPCIFLNLDRIDWRSKPAYAHWQLGQVVECVDELAGALARARSLQPRFEAAQRRMAAHSIDHGEGLASQRQADAILEFAKRRASA